MTARPTTAAALAPGLPYPLGAAPRPGGVNFAVFSAHATCIEVCVFDQSGRNDVARHALTACVDHVWHGFLPGAGAGLLYGLRAHGPFAPELGHRFNPNKLLLDPYAREIFGRFQWRDEHHAYAIGHPDADRAFDTRDNGASMLKARVVDRLPPLQQPKPRRPLIDSVIYELHVKGFTRQLEAVPPQLRGTYAGLGHPAAIAHMQRVGITALSILPVHYCVDEGRLGGHGLSNYWGYNTLGFFALNPRWSATPDDPAATRTEFRAMVEALHAAGIEVLLDVVYNHTCEGDQRGPSLSFRGLDHASYYRLVTADHGQCENFTGCGNTVNVVHPRVTQLVLDSLRYWVDEMGVDGFRFDIAPILGRTHPAFDSHAPFFTTLQQDPVLAGAKLIAEPWDVGPHGYQLGAFPGRWAEWNDRFRDGARLFWLSRGVGRGEFARRIAASSDKFHHGTRVPSASVNFVAAHDGFTLADAVSYNHRHNHANGEHNRDGHHANFTTNCGVEGPTTEAKVLAQRQRFQRALLATTLLAQGTPMLLAGDEFGRTQRGNNNAYCQDNEISWLDWARADARLTDFTSALIALRRDLPALRQDRWLSDVLRADGKRDVEWLSPLGTTMSVEDWHDDTRHCFGQLLAPTDGDATVLIIFNAEPAPLPFVLPPGRWQRLLDSASADVSATWLAGPAIEAGAHSVLLLIHQE
jgi:glycogen operon protein